MCVMNRPAWIGLPGLACLDWPAWIGLVHSRPGTANASDRDPTLCPEAKAAPLYAWMQVHPYLAPIKPLSSLHLASI